MYSEEALHLNEDYGYPNHSAESLGRDADRQMEHDLHNLRQSDGRQILEDYARMTGKT